MKFEIRPIFDQRYIVKDGTHSIPHFSSLEDAVIEACRISVVSAGSSPKVIREDLIFGKVYRRIELLDGRNIADYVHSLHSA